VGLFAQGEVPKEFMVIVSNAVRHNALSAEQGAELCEMLASGDPCLSAAWEVFLIEKDMADFVDTLLRISRMQVGR
jgi:precorrin-6B methylase 1